MGLFGFGSKKGDVVDLAERFKQQKKREAQQATSSSSSSSSGSSSFSMFDSGNKAQETDSENIDLASADERKKKLAKRLVDMTTKIEDLNNQIYHLQQRIEVLEKKNQANQTDQSTTQT